MLEEEPLDEVAKEDSTPEISALRKVRSLEKTVGEMKTNVEQKLAELGEKLDKLINPNPQPVDPVT